MQVWQGFAQYWIPFEKDRVEYVFARTRYSKGFQPCCAEMQTCKGL